MKDKGHPKGRRSRNEKKARLRLVESQVARRRSRVRPKKQE